MNLIPLLTKSPCEELFDDLIKIRSDTVRGLPFVFSARDTDSSLFVVKESRSIRGSTDRSRFQWPSFRS